MRVQIPNWTSRLIPLSAAATDSILNQDTEDEEPQFCISGISKDGTWGWLCKSNSVEVFNTQSGHRVGAWHFGAALKDPSTSVTAICEFSYGGVGRLVVATTAGAGETGIMCLFNVKSSKIEKAIEVPYRVTCLESIALVGPGQVPVEVLSEHLRSFCGIISVGTHRGFIYMIDLCLDEEAEISDELNPGALSFIDPSRRDAIAKRYNIVQNGQHPCIQLGEEAHSRGYYFFRKPDSSIVKTYSEDEVFVSSMKFTKQTGLLNVGFNFGCFQFWRLGIPVLEYSSRYEDGLPPVTHFAFQEPENDPRNFCYLWVTRGPYFAEVIDEYNSYISLHQLGYSKKNWHEDFGYLYEELNTVGPRFEHLLSTDPFGVTDGANAGSRVIANFTLTDPNYLPVCRDENEDSFEEGGGGPDISRSVFVWESLQRDGTPVYYLGVFDLNRWYHAQMPSSIRLRGTNRDACAYFAVYSLEMLQKSCYPARLQSIHVPYSSLSKYESTMLPAPEQHFYPSALAFDCVSVCDNGVVHAKLLGLQRQALADLQRDGPLVIMKPDECYSECTKAALIPKHTESTHSHSIETMKREALLSVTLDHKMINYLLCLVSHWSSGETDSSGCSLRTMMEWGWKKVASIKESVNRLCVPLYDWSGAILEQQTLQVLHQHEMALAHLQILFQGLLTQSTTITASGRQELTTKLKVVTLIYQHVRMTLWFYTEGLLPEHSVDEQLSAGQHAYPSKALKDFYTSRRKDIQKLHSELKASDVLFIDSILERTNRSVNRLWERDNGCGLYPPSSIYALLNIYLLEDVPLTVKHSIVFYFLCDLFYAVPEDKQEEFNEKLVLFCQAFSISMNVSKQVQGFFLQDHRDFEDALTYILDPVVIDLESWQHTQIIKSFLYQGRPKLALKYIRIKRPTMTTPEDVKLRLTVLLANGLTSEAFEYQRLCRDDSSAVDMLCHMFLGSQQMKTVDQLLLLPFHPEEENHLVSYLQTSDEPRSQEFLVMYFLQRARIIEAIRLNQKLKHLSLGDMDSKTRERLSSRNHIVEGYQKVLPSVQRKLLFDPEKPIQKRAKSRKDYVRPTPLSMTVNRARKAQHVTQSSLLKCVLEKVHEVNDATADDEQEQTSKPESPSENIGPFVCTPVTPRTKRRITDVSDVVFPSTNLSHHFQSNLLSPPRVGGEQSPNYSRLSGASPISRDLIRLADKLTGHRVRGADALSLLQTPPITKKKTPLRKSPSPTSLTRTPQSILKVRHKVNRRSPSPLMDRPKLKHMNDLHLPTPPRLDMRRSARFSTQPTVQQHDTTIDTRTTTSKTDIVLNGEVESREELSKKDTVPIDEVDLTGEVELSEDIVLNYSRAKQRSELSQSESSPEHNSTLTVDPGNRSVRFEFTARPEDEEEIIEPKTPRQVQFGVVEEQEISPRKTLAFSAATVAAAIEEDDVTDEEIEAEEELDEGEEIEEDSSEIVDINDEIEKEDEQTSGGDQEKEEEEDVICLESEDEDMRDERVETEKVETPPTGETELEKSKIIIRTYEEQESDFEDVAGVGVECAKDNDQSDKNVITEKEISKTNEISHVETEKEVSQEIETEKEVSQEIETEKEVSQKIINEVPCAETEKNNDQSEELELKLEVENNNECDVDNSFSMFEPKDIHNKTENDVAVIESQSTAPVMSETASSDIVKHSRELSDETKEPLDDNVGAHKMETEDSSNVEIVNKNIEVSTDHIAMEVEPSKINTVTDSVHDSVKSVIESDITTIAASPSRRSTRHYQKASPTKTKLADSSLKTNKTPPASPSRVTRSSLHNLEPPTPTRVTVISDKASGMAPVAENENSPKSPAVDISKSVSEEINIEKGSPKRSPKTRSKPATPTRATRSKADKSILEPPTPPRITRSKIDQKEEPLPSTPTRATRSKADQSVTESTTKSPSRRGRSKKAETPLTPSRRSNRLTGETAHEETEKVTTPARSTRSHEETEKVTTPARSTRSHEETEKITTPARSTRSHEETGKITTPARSTRSADETKKSSEKFTPSRTSRVVDSKTKDTTQKVTPSRRGRTPKSAESSPSVINPDVVRVTRRLSKELKVVISPLQMLEQRKSTPKKKGRKSKVEKTPELRSQSLSPVRITGQVVRRSCRRLTPTHCCHICASQPAAHKEQEEQQSATETTKETETRTSRRSVSQDTNVSEEPFEFAKPTYFEKTQGAHEDSGDDMDPAQFVFSPPATRSGRLSMSRADIEPMDTTSKPSHSKSITETTTKAPEQNKSRTGESDNNESKLDESMTSLRSNKSRTRDGGEDILAQGDGPISRESFMMSMRSNRKSREMTPEIGAKEAEEDVPFEFASPTSFNKADGEEDDEFGEEIPQFYFSPPITRRMSRNTSLDVSSSNLEPKQIKDASFNTIQDNALVGDLVKEARKEKLEEKRTRKTKSKSTRNMRWSISPSNSPVNLLSMPEVDEAAVKRAQGNKPAVAKGRKYSLRTRRTKMKVYKEK